MLPEMWLYSVSLGVQIVKLHFQSTDVLFANQYQIYDLKLRVMISNLNIRFTVLVQIGQRTVDVSDLCTTA